MKRIIWIVIIIAALAGCNEKRHPLLKEAADIMVVTRSVIRC